jgi:predicted TIM-barrel fold metal-dependent hydrolase
MLIDAHCHIHLPAWRQKTEAPAVFGEYIFEKAAPEYLLNSPCANLVDRFVVFPIPDIMNVNIEVANQGILDFADKTPQFFPFVVIDHSAEAWINKGCFGFKEHPYGQYIQKNGLRQDICSEEFFDSYAVLEKYGWPLWLHCGTNIEQRLLESILPAFPNLRLVLCHMSDPMAYGFNLQQTVQRLKKFRDYIKSETVYYDISAVRADHDIEFLAQTVDIAGVEKCIFGSDFPFSNPEQILQAIEKIKLTVQERELIFHKNFEKLMTEVFKMKGLNR